MNMEELTKALSNNGIKSVFVKTSAEVKPLVESLLIPGSEVMQMSSVSLDETGVSDLINNSGKYDAIKPKLWATEDNGLTVKEKTRMASVPDFAVGSVQAVTEAGELVIASNTGSQLPAYAYGPSKIIFVVGKQKLVKDLVSAMDRIYKEVLPKESERARKAYGVSGSNVSKILIINKEVVADRITVIFVDEHLGY